MKVFLILNDVELDYTVDAAESFVLQIARGELGVPDISEWLRIHKSAHPK
jgi:prophage maintenance system killer protein